MDRESGSNPPSHLANRGPQKGKCFQRQDKEVINRKKKKELIWVKSLSFGDKRVLLDRLPLLPLGHGKGHVTDYLIGADQKIPDGLVKTAFLGEFKPAIRLDMKPQFGGFA